MAMRFGSRLPWPSAIARVARRRATTGTPGRLISSGSSSGCELPEAFTRTELDRVSSLLARPAPYTPDSIPPHTVTFQKRPASEAAVLIPLLNVNGAAHVLFEVRSGHLRTHGGEVSFPGGRMDKTDTDLVHTALRETHEELGLSPDNVEILGMLDPPEYSLGNKSRVWPFVGFVHAEPSSRGSTSDSLLSLNTRQLTPSPDEVSSVFTFPLAELRNTQPNSIHDFRLDPRRPYHKYRVGHLLPPESLATDEARHEAAKLEVWGLSGWFLNRLAWQVGWMSKPPVEEYDA